MPLCTEVAVVGAGPAGLAAAAAAGEAGCTVTVVDAYARPGGQYYKQTPADFGARTPEALHHDFSVAARLFDRIGQTPGVRLLNDTSVWTAQVPADGGPITLALTGGSADAADAADARELRARAVILAPRADDRALPFPGWDLPGVLTAGAAQTLVKSQRVLPGRRILLAGAGPFLLPVATALAQGGAHVVAVLEATTPRGWARYAPTLWGHGDKLREGVDYTRLLRHHHVPLRFGRAVIRAEGDGRVERVTVARLTADWTPIAGSEEGLDVDTLCAGYGFTPSTELSYLLGCAHRYEPTQGSYIARRDGDMRSSRPGVYVAGEITGIGGSAVALPEGAIAGLAAARDLGRLSEAEFAARAGAYRRDLRRQQAFANTLNALFALRPGRLAWMTPDTIVCRCEEVTYGQVETAVREGHAHDVKAVKALTRCGMGLCQGRVCEHAIAAVTAALSGRDPAEVGAFTGRPIVKPVALGAIGVL